jgi:hypothetical protein
MPDPYSGKGIAKGKDCPFCRRMRWLLIFTLVAGSLLFAMVKLFGLEASG